jgi:hypothetical protein
MPPPASVYPAALDTEATLLKAKNLPPLTLAVAIGTGATATISVVEDVSAYPDASLVTIGDLYTGQEETFYYTAKNNATNPKTLTVAQRDVDGTGSVAHGIGERVQLRQSASMRELLSQAVRNVQGLLGVYGRDLTRWLDIEHYGALGDGSNDDAIAVQNACNDAYAQGGKDVIVPSGAQFWMKSPVTIKSRTRVRGERDYLHDIQDGGRNDVLNWKTLEQSVLCVDHNRQAMAAAGPVQSGGSWTWDDGLLASPAFDTTDPIDLAGNQALAAAFPAAFKFTGTSPGMSGLTIWYPKQIHSFRHWDWPQTSSPVTDATPPFVYPPSNFRTHPTGGTVNPDKVLRIQSTGLGDAIWELDRIRAGASPQPDGGYATGATEPTWPAAGAGVEILDGDVWWKNVQGGANTLYTQQRAPYVYPPLFWADPFTINHNVANCSIRDMLLLNPYEAMRFEQKNNLTSIENWFFGAIRRGIYWDNSSGLPRMTRFHHTLLTNLAFGEHAHIKTGLAEWLQGNLIVYEFGYMDGLTVFDLFSHDSKMGMVFREGVSGINGEACRGKLFSTWVEGCSHTGVYVEATNETEGIQFDSSLFSGPEVTLRTAVGPNAHPVFVRVDKGEFVGLNPTYHIFHQSGILQIDKAQINQPATVNNIRVEGAGVDAFDLSQTRWGDNASGVGLFIQDNLDASVVLVGNDLNGTTYNDPTTKPTRLYRAAANSKQVASTDDRVLDSRADVVAAATTSAINLLSITMVNLAPKADEEYEIYVRGVIDNNATGGTLTLRIVIAAAVLATANFTIPASAQTDRPFFVRANVAFEAVGASGFAVTTMRVEQQATGATMAETVAGSGRVSVSTVAGTLAVQSLWAANNANNVVTKQYGRIRRIG